MTSWGLPHRADTTARVDSRIQLTMELVGVAVGTTALLYAGWILLLYAGWIPLRWVHVFEHGATFSAFVKCATLAAVCVHAFRRANNTLTEDRSTPRVPRFWLGLMLACTILAVFATTSQIEFGTGKLGTGYGHDGVVYGAMTDNFAWFKVKVTPPYSGRFLAPMLIAYSSLNTFLGYKILSILSFLGSCWIIWLIGHRLRAPVGVTCAVVLLFAFTKFGLKFWLYYPVLTDGLGNLFLFLCVYAVIAEKHALFAVTLAVGLACRENLIVLIPFYLAHALRDRDNRCGWPRHLAFLLIPLTAFLLYKFFPVFLADRDYSVLHTMAGWANRFVRQPANQHVFVTAHFNALGMLAVVPLLHARELVAFFRSEPEWLVYAAATAAVSVLGGYDYDRFALWQVPTVAAFFFRVLAKLPLYRLTAWLVVIVALQLVASEVLLYWAPDESFYLSRYAVYAIGRVAFAAILAFTTLLLIGSVVLKRRFERALPRRPGEA